MKKLLIVSSLLFSSVACAGVSFGVTINGPGYQGSISTYQSGHYHRPPPVYVAPPVQYAPYPVYRTYIEPPRFYEPPLQYKTPSYYHQRNSCFPYPIYDYRGVVISHEIRCM